MRFDEAIRSGVQIRLLTVKNDGTYPTHLTCRIEGVDVVEFCVLEESKGGPQPPLYVVST